MQAGPSETDWEAGGFDQLDQMEKAEPLDPEEDLVLRMQAVSKLRHVAGVGSKERKKGGSRRDGSMSFAPRGAIGKRRQQSSRAAKPDGMQVDSRGGKPSAVAAAAAMAVAAENAPPPVKLKRSYSI